MLSIGFKPVPLPHNSNAAAHKPPNKTLRNAILVSSIALSIPSCEKTHDPCASPSTYAEGLSRKERIALSRQWIQTCKPDEKVREKFGERGVDILGGITQEWIHGRPTRELIRDLVREQPDSLEVINFLEEHQFIPEGGWAEGFVRKMAQQTGEERRRHKKQTLEEIVDELRCSRCCGRYATRGDCEYLERTDATGRKRWDVDKVWRAKKDEVVEKFGKRGGLVYQLWHYGIFPSYPPPADMEAKRELQSLVDTEPKETLEILAFLEENGVIVNENWGQRYENYMKTNEALAKVRSALSDHTDDLGPTVAFVLGSILVLGSGAYLGHRIRKKSKAKAAFERARQAMMQTYQPTVVTRPLAEAPKKEAEAGISTAKSGGEDVEKKLEEELKKDVETYRAKISDLSERLRNATKVKQLLQLDVEWQNLLSEMFSKSRDYYGCSPRGEGYLERGLGAPLREEILLMEEAIDDAAYRIDGKFNMNELLYARDDFGAFIKLPEKIFEEMGSASLKDDLDVGGRRETEFAQDMEFYKPKIEDLRERMDKAKTVEELLRLEEGYHNITHRMYLKGSIYYWSNRDHKGYPRRSLNGELRFEGRMVRSALNRAAHRIAGKHDFEELLFGEGSEETRKIAEKIFDEMASAERKRELARYRKRKMEKAKKEENMQTGA